MVSVIRITFGEVINAVKSANLQRGGRFLEVSERYYTVRGVGYIRWIRKRELA